MVVIASSHLLLVTNGAVIGGACEFTSVVVTNGAVNGGDCEFTSVVSNLTTDVNSRAPPITALLVTNSRCELASTTNYCSISY
jgi:hypothetical protein